MLGRLGNSLRPSILLWCLPLVVITSGEVAATGSKNCNHGAGKPPLHIFLLAGQSNMVGQGSVEHLMILLNDAATHEEYSKFWDDDKNDWASREDVYVEFYGQRSGQLSVGFGEEEDKFGPELGFGWTLADEYLTECETPILVLKTAWGGRDIAVDLRSPSSGKGDYDNVHPSHYGWQYREMIEEILDTLEHNLPSLVPGYNDNNDGYILKGLVWFQGWNDMIDEQKAAEYASNLANLIRDIRADLDVPRLPVVIGELGAGGLHAGGAIAEIRTMQKNVTQLEEFKDSTRFVPTAQYVVNDGVSYNGDYHYYGRADTFYHVGKAFGDAMADLLGLLKKENYPEAEGPSTSTIEETQVRKRISGNQASNEEDLTSNAESSFSGQENGVENLGGN